MNRHTSSSVARGRQVLPAPAPIRRWRPSLADRNELISLVDASATVRTGGVLVTPDVAYMCSEEREFFKQITQAPFKSRHATAVSVETSLFSFLPTCSSPAFPNCQSQTPMRIPQLGSANRSLE
jgi:hypothetical protein